eukprot:TRINITY_DN3626_c0_g1_i1.p1 TRINITY_DN3626_c0_g1~~TRINITY_DN3626_c0_g1_i1.p1  ORF type:complete len:107 (+),score=29.21 TRINITY_DN3626_c0_g1_i1:101-421(+)
MAQDQVAFRMQLKAGNEEEYKKRHDEIWPELSKLLTEAGIHDYSIFLDKETLSLFAILRLKKENRNDQLPGEAIMKKWWDYMAPLMEVHPNNQPKTWPLTPIFRME